MLNQPTSSRYPNKSSSSNAHATTVKPDSPTGISIIIITLNEAKRIRHLLDDLSAQTFRDFEVVLVDSNSDDNTCAVANSYLDKLPSLTVKRMQQRGVSLGRNTGAALANYERLLFLDADVRLDKRFLEKAAAHLQVKPTSTQALTASSLETNDLTAISRVNDASQTATLQVAGVYLSAKGLPKRFMLGYKLFNAGIFVTQFIFPTAIGACLFSTKTIHQAINGFDETVTLCEDCDYVNRASKLTQFRMLPLTFTFDPRRLRQDGTIKTGWKYLYANTHRLLIGEIREQKIRYDFGHYDSAEYETKQSRQSGQPKRRSIALSVMPRIKTVGKRLRLSTVAAYKNIKRAF